MAETIKQPVVPYPETVRKVLERAQAGDQGVVPELRAVLEQYPDLTRKLGDLPGQVELALLDLLCGPSLLAREAIRAQLEAMRADLGLEEATELEARLLAGEDTQEIARKCALSAAAVDSFEALFFNVNDRPQARDWVVNRVIGSRARRGLTESDTDLLLKLYAYHGGPLVIDSLIWYFQTPVSELPAADNVDGVESEEMRRRQLIHTALLARVVPAEVANLPAPEEALASILTFPAPESITIPCKQSA